ncbi:MAG: hypothetical protein U9O94_07510 [Nanoarchaeota archaeon]|nr:hypothetical protein [Nanoarchaeota archaeon]
MAKKSSEVVYLEIEKSRLNREKSRIVLNMGLILYFGFMVAGIVGFAFDYVDSFLLNVLVICGIIILIISTVPYLVIVHKEEKFINNKLDELK